MPGVIVALIILNTVYYLRSEEHTSVIVSFRRPAFQTFCSKKKNIR